MVPEFYYSQGDGHGTTPQLPLQNDDMFRNFRELAPIHIVKQNTEAPVTN